MPYSYDSRRAILNSSTQHFASFMNWLGLVIARKWRSHSDIYNFILESLLGSELFLGLVGNVRFFAVSDIKVKKFSIDLVRMQS
jgi:hypothetical protein